MPLQIEKFIESIFPSQTAEDAQRRVAGEISVAEAKKRAEDAENKADIYFLMIIMFGMVVLIAGTMMIVAWWFGARFDLAFKEVLSGNFKPPQSIESPIGRDEL